MLTDFKHTLGDVLSRLAALRDNARCREMCSHYQILDRYKRICHFHIRKTAGTSINHAFFDLGCTPKVNIHKHFFRAPRFQRRIISNGLIFVSHDRYLIRQGLYWYASSHYPMHVVRPPQDTFTFTILRDPVKRLVSHYRMLMEIRSSSRRHPLQQSECLWLGRSFGEFLQQVPRDHLARQLYMFSRSFSVDEALQNIMNCQAVLLTESMNADTEKLAQRLNLTLKLSDYRKSKIEVPISEAELAQARQALADEYELLQRVKQARG